MLETHYEKYDQYDKLFHKDTKLPCALFNDVTRKSHIQYRANWHEELEVQYVISGEGYVLIDCEKYSVSAGDFVVANQNCVHYTGTDDEMLYAAIVIKTEFLNTIGIDLSSITYKTIVKSDKLEELFANLVKIYSDDECTLKKARLHSVLTEYIIELTEHFSKTKTENTSLKTTSMERVKETIAYIRANFSKKITLDTLADIVYLDKFTLSRNFKSATGQTIVEYISNYRCEKAKQMIKDGTPVSEAALKCGFNNMSFFTKTFKNFTGKLPSEYKNK